MASSYSGNYLCHWVERSLGGWSLIGNSETSSPLGPPYFWIVAVDTLPAVYCKSTARWTWWGNSPSLPHQAPPTPPAQIPGPCTCLCDGCSGWGWREHNEEGVSCMDTQCEKNTKDDLFLIVLIFQKEISSGGLHVYFSRFPLKQK